MGNEDRPILNRRVLMPGATVIREGDTGDHAYLIERGRVEVFTQDEDGNIRVFTELGPGAIFGEMAAITNVPRSASVRALEETVLMTVSAARIRQQLENSDAVFQAILRVLAHRLHHANKNLRRQLMDIDELESLIEKNVSDIGFTVPEEKSREFMAEVAPVVDMLKEKLRKYKDHAPA